MRYQLHTRKSRHKVLWWSLGVAVIVGLFVAGKVVFGAKQAPVPRQSATDASHKSPTAGGGLTSHIQLMGDVMWGRTIETRSKTSPHGYTYPTGGLTAQDRNQYDAWIANFECPITNNTEPLSTQIAILKFNCRPEFLPNLAKWFTAVGLANNHTMNQNGQTGLVESRRHLQKAGIQYFGNYDMNQTDDICEVIAVPATVTNTHKKATIPLAMCGYMYVVDTPPTDGQLAVMQKYARVMPVIAFPHMGVEFRATAEAEKISAYHRMIDSGADAVIGAHPHVIQNSEAYKGRLIAYSLGNFLFDQQSLGQDTSVGLAVDLTLAIADEHAAKVYEIVAPSCATYKDNCVAKLATELQTRPRISVKYAFKCYDESNANGRVPRLGSKAVCDAARRTATVDRLTSLTSQW